MPSTNVLICIFMVSRQGTGEIRSSRASGSSVQPRMMACIPSSSTILLMILTSPSRVPSLTSMNKIERIDKEIAKTREKITEYQNRLRGLEAQKTEAENLQIVQLVRSMRLSPHELSAMLSGGGIPGMEAAPGYPAEPADHDTEEMEDTENE